MLNTKPTLQEFGEESIIEYRLTVEVNGEEVDTVVTGYDIENIIEQSSKLETAVREALEEQYEDVFGIPLPESE